MNENGSTVKTWYWNVARSMRAQGSHMHITAITTKRQCQAAALPRHPASPRHGRDGEPERMMLPVS